MGLEKEELNECDKKCMRWQDLEIIKGGGEWGTE